MRFFGENEVFLGEKEFFWGEKGGFFAEESPQTMWEATEVVETLPPTNQNLQNQVLMLNPQTHPDLPQIMGKVLLGWG